jgi:hypothetical protein
MWLCSPISSTRYYVLEGPEELRAAEEQRQLEKEAERLVCSS